MNLTIIPFFLVAQLGLPGVEKWKYGPEINYQIHILTSVVIDGEGDQMGTDVNGNMGCRPKDVDTLVCRIASINVRNYSPTNSTNEIDDMEGGLVFEINFDERGVKSVTTHNPIFIGYLRMIRTFAAQMSVGFDIRQHVGLLSSSFVQKENFLLGECSTAFNVSWKVQERREMSVSSEETSDDNSDSRPESGDIRLTLMDVPKKENSNVKLVIEKFRNPKRCTLGNKYPLWVTTNNVDFSVISSFSRIDLKENESFESSTVTTVKLKLRKAATLHEFAKIELMSIGQATGPLPEVRNPWPIGLSDAKPVENNFAE